MTGDPRLHVLNLVAGDPTQSSLGTTGNVRLEGMFNAIADREWVAVAWFRTPDANVSSPVSIVWAGRVDRRAFWDLNVSAADWSSGELDVLARAAADDGFVIFDGDDYDQAFPSTVYLDVLGWTDTGAPFLGRAMVFPSDGGRGFGQDWELVDAWWQS